MYELQVFHYLPKLGAGAGKPLSPQYLMAQNQRLIKELEAECKLIAHLAASAHDIPQYSEAKMIIAEFKVHVAHKHFCFTHLFTFRG